ncbi:Survival of motor neuron-related-splicing factor 30 (Survival motor neuron domain-containing protein 1) [Durusdinium trenchii]|uniref:Survival of motor neuron-related-splicing factor 30 (Survival motor neuron domain-containing protein 1) n=1 Tax=Durusdinium trenchii TaxID=1381693 RepID=A0ABP0KNC8_9DINO
MDFSQSAEELLTKLDTYREQLAQVEEALEQQPDEPSLVKLKNDLTEVIVLTEDLVKYQAAAPTEAEQAAGAETAGTTGRASVVPPRGTQAARVKGIRMGYCTEDMAAECWHWELSLQMLQLRQPTQTSRSAAGLCERAAAKSVHTALVGRTCEAFFEQKWYNGEIKSVRRDERGQERAMVEFIGFSNQREFKVTDVRLLRPPHPAQCQPGTRCQAIFPEDGLWYDCVITEQTEKGYKITFIDYGSKAEVKFDQIRLQSTGKVGQQKRTIKEVTTPAGYKIPESMQIAKTDTEDIIEAKRRKITAAWPVAGAIRRPLQVLPQVGLGLGWIRASNIQWSLTMEVFSKKVRTVRRKNPRPSKSNSAWTSWRQSMSSSRRLLLMQAVD